MHDIIGYPKNLTHYHVGWFQDTLSKEAESIRSIALLRLDGDWYESTKVCLDYLYDKIVDGGFLVIDDYGKWEGCRTAIDEFNASLETPFYLHYVNRATRYAVIDKCRHRKKS